MWYKNLLHYIHLPQKPQDIHGANFDQLPFFLGNQLYAFESMGSLFTIRSTLKKRSNMKQIILYSYCLVLFLFITNGLSFLFTYGESGVKNMPFDNFPNDHLIDVFRWLFYLTLPATLLIFIIANCHELEYEGYFHDRLTNN